MSAAEFELDLIDGISKPAGDAIAELKGLTAELGKADKAVNKLSETSHKHHQRERAEKGFLKEFTGSLVPEIAIGELLAEGVKKIGESITELVKYGVEVADFKEDTVQAYGILGAKGEALFDDIDKLAARVHLPAEQAHAITQDLLTRGMDDQETIKNTIEAIADMKRSGMAGGAEKLEGIVERAISSDSFSPKIKMLASAGINVEELAHRLGVSMAQLRVDLKAGTIDAKKGIDALNAVVTQGKIGEIAAAKVDFGDIGTDFKNSIRSMFQDVNFQPLIAGLQDVVSLFRSGSASADGMKEAAQSGIESIVSGLGSMMTDAAVAFVDLEKAGYDTYIAWFPVIKAFAEVDAFLDRISLKGNPVGDAMAKQSDANAARSAEIDKSMADMSMSVSHGMEHMFDKFNSGETPLDAIKNGLKSMGFAIDDGLAAAPERAHAIGVDTGHAFIAGVREGTDTHSPSREMMRVREDLDAGLAMSDDRSGSQLASSLASSMPGALATSAQQPSAGANVTIDIGGIHVHGTTAAEIIPLLESQIVDVFERAALEMGA